MLVVRSTVSITEIQIAIRVTNQEGIPVFTTTNCDHIGKLSEITKGHHRFRVSFPRNFLPPGHYSLIVASFIPGVRLFDVVEDKLGFSVDDMGTHATIMRDGRLGVVTPVLLWDEI